MSLNNEELKFSIQTDNEAKQKNENFHIMFIILEKYFNNLLIKKAFLRLKTCDNAYGLFHRDSLFIYFLLKKIGEKQNSDIIVRKYFCFWRNYLRINRKIMKISQNFNAFNLKNAVEKWRNLSKFSKKIKTIEIKFLLCTLNKIFILRKKEFFSILVSNKDITYFENIIKNIIPITNIFALICNKIRQNHSLGFNNIFIFSRSSNFQRFFSLQKNN